MVLSALRPCQLPVRSEMIEPYECQLLGGRDFALLNVLLSPFKVLLDLLCGLHAVCEVGTRVLQPALGKCLQLEQLAILGVQFPRPTESQQIYIMNSALCAGTQGER